METNWSTAFAERFSAGSCRNAGDTLGAHRTADGTVFRVWAPNAVQVSVTGDFCGWKPEAHPMTRLSGGIWEAALPDIGKFAAYKYAIKARNGQTLWKSDPYGSFSELRPASASRVFDIGGFDWGDERWLAHRRAHKVYDSPLNIYELHPGSWKRHADGAFFSYTELAEALIPYIIKTGFTHVELLPVTEYPFDASWGYQCTGYFAATSRFGTPHELMGFVDVCHRAGIGVIMDWVPAHFPKDPHGLVEFDGGRLYEEADPLMAEHPSWGTRIFDYAKGEVRSFLISSALFWLEKFHMDGLRVDAVASMLYLDYDRAKGRWKPNRFGGRENLGAVAFLRQLNEACFAFDDSVLMIAEESTAWPLVTAPASAGGLGFNLKWNMGWMNDSLHYLKTDPYFRAGTHHDLTFSLMYAFSENFILPLSHDEVVHMKGALLNKAPGTDAQKFATVRAFWAYTLAHPGKKLLFMGAELGQKSEWDFAAQLPWALSEKAENAALCAYFCEANRFYKGARPLWECDFEGAGFRWLCPDESLRNILGFTRRDKKGRELVFLCNFSGIEARRFCLGMTGPGAYKVVFSTDEPRFGGGGALVAGAVFCTLKTPRHNLPQMIVIDIPPLTGVFMRRTRVLQPQNASSAARSPG
ncbi:MAG: 1,4-alpha-glucan branching protein GlgB [Oscillospiraceae bacterium]|jgi:1,4-alpha-glucan branching enzyme|nr:1,4-alpha-glucan branching protein GlgB [Oscillospiraceae bacterium]